MGELPADYIKVPALPESGPETPAGSHLSEPRGDASAGRGIHGVPRPRRESLPVEPRADLVLIDLVGVQSVLPSIPPRR